MVKTRKYNCKDVEMLMAAKTIAESFRANISDLATARTDWTEQFATNLIARIDQAIDSHLGVDAKKDLRHATSTLTAIQAPAKRDASFLKTQIDADFQNNTPRRDEILRTLGFTSQLREVQKGSQEALVQLLYQFKSNLTDPLRQEITAKGISPILIDKILGYADTFAQANVTQETLKGHTKEITKEVIDVFNTIYAEIVSICKIASHYFQYETLKKEQFTFSKVLANLGASSRATPPTPSPA